MGGRQTSGGADRTQERDQLILDRLARIERKVDSLAQTHALTVRHDQDLLEKVLVFFRGSKRRVQVYLAADGERSVSEIAEHLGMKRQNVGSVLKSLARKNLLEMNPSGGRDLWCKSAIDRSIGISQLLIDEHGFETDGRRKK